MMGLFNAKCASTARLDGKTAVITGCNTGIGKITARDLYQRGAKVIMACRNLEKAKEAMEEIKQECKGQENLGNLSVIPLDLSSLKSVRDIALQLNEEEKKIDLLINNAGVMMCPLERTADGFEMQIGTNHFGHFLLTMLLLPKIIKSAPARIVNVSSLAHMNGKLDLDDINWEKRSYSAIGAYGQSKLCNILFTRQLALKLKESGITGVTVYSLHPGVINTELTRHLDSTYFQGLTRMFKAVGGWFMKTPEQGAQTTIHCAVSEEAGKETGLYYAECKPTSSTSAAENMEDAKKLWIESLKIVNLPENFDPFTI
ncbi:PREDICTED: retinol dehydrogenase 13-like [Nicrophorus vespilloides]|uniref:Retinol dehydrogenase 13-like n=1 Tax=Nicrophorus vespilloides TaxID=110193 RepID=A0ABM1M5C6_NICVS|nr:PREDICTED: retinol dehydrogenase 13-like [Nicrophorus vespilloides]